MKIFVSSDYLSSLMSAVRTVKGVEHISHESYNRMYCLEYTDDVIDSLPDILDYLLELGYPEFEGYELIHISEDTVYIGKRKRVEVGNITYSNSKGTEPIWISSVTDIFNSIKSELPIQLMFNPAVTKITYSIPSVVATPRNWWESNYRTANILNSISTLKFREHQLTIDLPKRFKDADIYSFNDNTYHDCVIGYLIKNQQGVGNTLLLNSIMFAESSSLPGTRNIFNLLTKKKFWEKVIIPFITSNFEEVVEDIVEYPVPIEIRCTHINRAIAEKIVKEIENYKIELEDSKEQVKAYIESITTQKLKIDSLISTIQEKEKEHKKLLKSKTLANDIIQIYSLPFVEDFIVDNDYITIKLHPIQIDSGPFLGPYVVKYNLTTNKLYITNTGNPIDGLAHPHCEDGRSPCLGNYDDMYYHLSSGHYHAAIVMIHKFLSTYNPEDSWGDRLSKWDAKYWFNDLAVRGLEDKIQGYASLYHSTFGYYPECVDICEFCGRLSYECACPVCSCCNEVLEYCECTRCSSCGELVLECDCE